MKKIIEKIEEIDGIIDNHLFKIRSLRRRREKLEKRLEEAENEQLFNNKLKK